MNLHRRRPLPPAAGAVFSDEPPPLDESSDESDGDIFAQLHKNKPYDNKSRGHDFEKPTNRARNPVADLFSGLKDTEPYDDENVFEAKPPPLDDKQKSPLLDGESEPELFVQSQGAPNTSTSEPNNIKKPVGGISLFGNNRGAESIGAAILRRNQKKSISEDENDEMPIKRNETKSAEKNILDDIFAKPEKPTKNLPIKENRMIPKKVVLPKTDKIDLFSDDLFDDIDDIFSSNTKPAAQKPATQTSLFDDDLFSDVGVKETDKKVKPKIDKGLFDSDDELFNEKIDVKSHKSIIKETVNRKDKYLVSNKSTNKLSTGESSRTVNVNAKIVKSDDSEKGVFDSDEELFLSNTNDTARNKIKEYKDVNKLHVDVNNKIFDSNEDIDKVENKTENINVSDTFSNSNVTKIDENDFLEDKKDFDKIIGTTNQILKDNTPTKFVQFDNEEKILNKQTVVLPKEGCSTNENVKISTNNNMSDEQLFSKASSSEEEDNFDKLNTRNAKVESHIYNKSNIDKKSIKTDSLFDDFDDDDTLFSNSNVINKDNSIKSNIDIVKKVHIQRHHKEFNKENKHFIPQQIPSNEQSYTDENRTSIFIEPNTSQHLSSTALFVENDDNSLESPTFMEQLNNDSVLRTTKIISDHEQLTTESKGNKSKPDNLLNKIENTAALTSPNMFDDDEFEENLFNKSTLAPSKNNFDIQKTNREIKTDTDNNHNVDTNKNIKENHNLLTKTEKFVTNDVFSDVFSDLPPDFEKPKEPKRSRDVNALFDDDSDDETLFFRKTDPTLDELPKELGANTNQNIFGLFHDEPPAIDVDFTTKTSDTKKQMQPSDTNQTTAIKNVDIEGLDEHNQNKSNKKPVGKLKSMNLNINVNTLLPGASPKKQKSVEQVDGQNASTLISVLKNIDKELENTIESNKVASFDDKTDSSILNNRISKERAKIQIKRRPSTRRARIEAARKSGIDFGQDFTDKSSPVYGYPEHSEKVKSEEPLLAGCRLNENALDSLTIDTEYIDPVVNAENSNVVNTSTKAIVEENEKEVIKEIKCEDNVENVKHYDNVPQTINLQKSVTSKTVYILNDEDIFTDKKIDTSIPKTNVDISSKCEKNTGITTLGTVYKEQSSVLADGDDMFKRSNDGPKTNLNVNEPKKSLFDDLSDDESELFGGKKTKEPKNNINTSNEDELFSKGNMDNKKSIVKKDNKVTKSLFGDDDDDDDLFAVKPKKSESKSQASKPIERDNAIKQKEKEVVFVDPLSQLVDEE